ncbi:hypothetical protein F4821DRAFT_167790 [Hypoxylon rubiginosum]|uniref:Uncharacterized protein n=1 Tax=Hypoxylon rubiginosum TaxID=110542 RepID=A0ACC0CX52_9PEZI|nr:hypothetical protein F4821DRAFT_167790 [Hypoxylon rubiginosum]
MDSTESTDSPYWRATWYNVTLEDVLPTRGFEFEDDQQIFEDEQDGYLVKMALQVVTPSLDKHEVDAALASLMKDAIRIGAEFRAAHPTALFIEGDSISPIPISAVFEEARKQSRWAIDLPTGIIPHLMDQLIHERYLYITFSHFRGMSKSDRKKKPGQLATAIDEWLHDKPVEEPDEIWVRSPVERIKYMMDKMLKREGADWGADDSDYLDEEEDHTADAEMGDDDDVEMDDAESTIVVNTENSIIVDTSMHDAAEDSIVVDTSMRDAAEDSIVVSTDLDDSAMS